MILHQITQSECQVEGRPSKTDWIHLRVHLEQCCLRIAYKHKTSNGLCETTVRCHHHVFVVVFRKLWILSLAANGKRFLAPQAVLF